MKMLDAYLQHNKPYLTFYILQYVYALLIKFTYEFQISTFHMTSYIYIARKK